MKNDQEPEPEDIVLDRDVLLSYDAPAPPADLADRVLGKLRKRLAAQLPGRRPRLRRWGIVGGSLAVAAAAGFFGLRLGPAESGRRVTSARESIAMGARAVAVAEPQAELEWVVARGGAGRVSQARGEVFYRVERGGPFVVATPVADVQVLGTCFRVEVSEMKSQRRTIMAGAAGAALSAAVLVTVYEGRVMLANAHGSVTLGPGEHGSAAQGSAPTRSAQGQENALLWSNSVLQARVHKLEEELRKPEQQADESDGSDKRFVREERNPSWAAREEQLVRERLTRFLGVDGDRASVECRQTCCELMMDSPSWKKAEKEIWSDVGIGHFVSKGFSVSQQTPENDTELADATFCLQPQDVQPRADADRGAERQALLAASRSAVEACMRGQSQPLDFESHLRLDEAGAVKGVTSIADPVGHGAAACVEQAILAAARFAPTTKETGVTIELHLKPLP